MSGSPTITGKPIGLFSATGIVYVKRPDLLTDARAIIDAAQASAYHAVNVALVYRNWLLGCADAGHVFDAGRRKVAQTFRHRFHSLNTAGSGKAASYVRALDMLGPILAKHYPKPIVGGSMWHGFSLADLHTLHEWMCADDKKS